MRTTRDMDQRHARAGCGGDFCGTVAQWRTLSGLVARDRRLSLFTTGGTHAAVVQVVLLVTTNFLLGSPLAQAGRAFLYIDSAVYSDSSDPVQPSILALHAASVCRPLRPSPHTMSGR